MILKSYLNKNITYIKHSTMEYIQAYYQKVGTFSFESNTCLIADISVNFDDSKKTSTMHPMDKLSDADKNLALLIENVNNDTPWHTFIKIDSETGSPLTLIAVAEDFLDNDDPESTEDWCWEECGFILSKTWIGIFDFTYFDDDEYIYNLYPDFMTNKNKNTLWFSYAVDKAEKADYQAYFNTIPFGVVGQILGDRFLQIEKMDQYNHIGTAAFRIHLSEKSHMKTTIIPTTMSKIWNVQKERYEYECHPSQNNTIDDNINDIDDNIQSKNESYHDSIQNNTFNINIQQELLINLTNILNNQLENNYLIESAPKVNNDKIKEI